MLRRSSLLLGSVLLLGVLAARGGASSAGETWLIRNARVLTGTGETLPRASVLIKDGVIDQIAPDLPTAPGAREMDAGGLTLHPAIVDVSTTYGQPETIPTAVGPRNPPAPDLSTPQAHLAATAMGVTPAWKVAAAFKQSALAEEARLAGIAAVITLPSTGAVPGQAALVRTQGETPAEALLADGVGVCFRFAGGGGRYPGTLMAILAAQRQVLADAQRRRQVVEAGGMPEEDAAAAALLPALQRTQPIFFAASREREIRRALLLAQEFGLQPVIVGAEEAWRVIPELKASGASVVYSLGSIPASPPEGRADPATAPGLVRAAGIPMALSTQMLGGYGNLSSRLQRLRAAGWSTDDLIRALCLEPARLAGQKPGLGALVPGAEANLVLSAGEPFTSPVRKVILGGRAFDPPANTPAVMPTPPRVGTAVALPTPPPAGGGSVLIRGGTLLTVTRGVIKNGSVLVINGKITAVGPADRVQAPAGVPVIEAAGKYVMPGIVDAHSHMAIEGGINEGTYSLTPEVRIAECVNPRDVTIYRALAGGVTTAHLMHGSANAIGGQNAQVKLKWGVSAADMLIPGAPRTVKFALGENPKRSNVTPQPGSTTPPRYPATRMGVEYILREAFTAARAYRARWNNYRRMASGDARAVPPRRDLRLEALADILDGKILVEAHSYRSDEILMLLRLAEDFGFKIRCLHHALEAYKVAPEVARHGAGVSTFADFWAYKVEAFDAIPHNAALCARAGVRVSFNSDSNERVRRMYWEAARLIKYGGLSEEEALKTITLHPAWQIGLEERIGSLEVGKDGDIAIFSAHPFAANTMCETTLVEGRVYFDRQKDLAMRKEPGYPGTDTEGTLNIGHADDHLCACDHVEWYEDKVRH